MDDSLLDRVPSLPMGSDVGQPSWAKRFVARLVAVAAGTAGSSVVVAVAVSDALRRRSAPPPPRNT